MKKFLLFLFTVVAFALPTIWAQSADNEDEVVKIEDYNRHASVPGDLIVKFADRTPLLLSKDAAKGTYSTGIASVDNVLSKYRVVEAKRLCPQDDAKRPLRTSKSFNGRDVVEKDLSRLCLLHIDSTSPVHQLIDELKALPEVEYAEPNYLVYALDLLQSGEPLPTLDSPQNTPFVYNDPLYSDQWSHAATGLDLLQAVDTNRTNDPVIAILDTGVDIDHPDLAENIWTNPYETDEDGLDNDGNGYVDDIHGWSFVSNYNNVHDFNAHGTHCAGIAAAVGGNGIGVVGANPHAKIMPVVVLQSNGVGNNATIIQGIYYAKNNGADVISMSFGGYSYSAALEEALGSAYQDAVLVGAAGNDGSPIDFDCSQSPLAKAVYPGAFSFVLGVQATMPYPGPCGTLACFSNFDCDGPCFSQFPEEQLYNYELSAPGYSILSTVPDGRYRTMHGTSMATPLVAGGISLLMHARSYPNTELLFGDLIQTPQEFTHVNFWDAYNVPDNRPAVLQGVTFEVNDTTYGDRDWRADAGETIEFYPTIRSVWGPTDSITVWLEVGTYQIDGETFEEYFVADDTTLVHFASREPVEFGVSLGSYGKNKSQNPIVLTLDSNIFDGRSINFVMCAKSPKAPDTLHHNISFMVENGVELRGMLTQDMTLYPNVHYIVTDNFAIPENVTLTIKPGTTLKFKDGVVMAVAGKIIAAGTPDSLITFTKCDNSGGWRGFNSSQAQYDSIAYCVFEYLDNNGYCRFGMENTTWGVYGVQDTSYSEHEDLMDGDDYIGYIHTNHTYYSVYNSVDSTLMYYRHEVWYDSNYYQRDSIPEYRRDGSNNYYTYVQSTENWGNRSRHHDLIFRDNDVWNALPTNVHKSVFYRNGNLANYDMYAAPCNSPVGDSYCDRDWGWGLPGGYNNIINNRSMEWAGYGMNTLRANYINYDTVVFPYLANVSVYNNSTTYRNVNREYYMNKPYFNKYYENHNYNISRTEWTGNYFANYAVDMYGKIKNEFYVHASSEVPATFTIGNLYMGSTRENILRKHIFDFEYPQSGTFGWVDLGVIAQRPSPLAHGIVWKINVGEISQFENDPNYVGFDAQDQFDSILPLGVGTYRFDVYFNRAMDTNVAPVVTMGVRSPYTQVVIKDNARWIGDTVYSVQLTLDANTLSDGLCRLAVSGAKDNEHFDVPVENSRFNVQISVAGSLSAGFQATGGVGKIDLEWNFDEVNFNDFLGYNMYRYTENEYHELIDTVLINNELIVDTMLTDYDVNPGQRYYYYYKVLRTSLDETDASKVVTAVPASSMRGDANGSFNVDVADVVTTISYITHNNPRPFLFSMADVNEDGIINILDVVGIINIILNPEQSGFLKGSTGTAVYTIEDGVLYVETPVALGGVQFSFNMDRSNTISVLEGLNGFEVVRQWMDDGTYMVLAYSMVGRTIPAGKTALLRIGEAEIADIILSDKEGGNVVAMKGEVGIDAVPEGQIANVYPNPFTGSVRIEYALSMEEACHVTFEVTDMLGRQVAHVDLGHQSLGQQAFTWTPNGTVSHGIYIGTLRVDGKAVEHIRLIKK